MDTIELQEIKNIINYNFLSQNKAIIKVYSILIEGNIGSGKSALLK